jgi:hypothetical protein
LCRVGPVHVGRKLLAMAGNPHIVNHGVIMSAETATYQAVTRTFASWIQPLCKRKCM